MLRLRNMNIQKLHWPRTLMRSRIVFGAKIVTIIAATIAIFYTGLVSIFGDVSQNEYAIYVFFVPFLVVYLTYRKRKVLRAVMPSNDNDRPKTLRNLTSLFGVFIVAIAIFLYWGNSYTFTPLESHIYTFAPLRLQILALPIFDAGLILVLFNRQTLRHLVLPIACFFFLFSPASEALTLTLLCCFILIIIGMAIFMLRSERTSKTRSSAVNLVKYDQCDHEPNTDAKYCRKCGRIFPQETARLSQTEVARIGIILLIACFLVTIQSPAFATNKITPIISASTSSGYSSQILPEINQYNISNGFEDHYLEAKYPDLLALEYEYSPFSNKPFKISVAIEMSSSQSILPSYKIPTETILLNKTTTVEIHTSYSSPITAYYSVNQSTVVTSDNIAVLYWNSSSVFRIDQTAQPRQVQTALTVSFVQIDQFSEVKQELIDIATNITNYWLSRSRLPNETWAETAAVPLSQNGLGLGVALTIANATILAYYIEETKRRERASKLAIAKLSSLNTEIVKALQRTNKPRTLSNIAATLQEATKQAIHLQKLEEQLKELENVGIIKSLVYCQNSIPIQTWKM